MRIGYATDACMTADALYQAEMEVSSAMMLDVLNGKMRAPADLRWRGDTRGGWSKARRGDELDRLRAQQAFIETRRIGGDQCARCGARPGACGHAPVRGGRLVCL